MHKKKFEPHLNQNSKIGCADFVRSDVPVCNLRVADHLNFQNTTTEQENPDILFFTKYFTLHGYFVSCP